MQAQNLTLHNIKICNLDKITISGKLCLNDGFLGSEATGNKIDLSGYIAYPGLFNAHDHLLGTYLPRVGNGPYLCWKPWDEDLKSASIYRERNKLSINQIYMLSYYRHILSGVTSVCDHIPHIINKEQIENSFIRIVEQYCIAHEMSSYELQWGEAHELEIKKSHRLNVPFITHIEEGFDEESKRGIEILKKKNGLFHNSVLVHCISCSQSDIKAIAETKASVVWCPASNYFMFNQTADIAAMLDQGINVCLGTDSPMSGSPHILDEMKVAKKLYYQIYHEDISSKKIMEMATINPAKAFKLDKLVGSLEIGKKADILILKDKRKNPYDQLIEAQPENIEIVIREGIPLFFQERHKKLIQNQAILRKFYKKITVHNGKHQQKAYLIGDPLKLLKQIRQTVNFKKNFSFFNIS